MIGHDVFHTGAGGGLNDYQDSRGIFAYSHNLNSPASERLYNSIKGTMVGANNPDNLVGEVYP